MTSRSLAVVKARGSGLIRRVAVPALWLGLPAWSAVRRHSGWVAALATAGLSAILAWLLGASLQAWVVALGMDDERADLLAAMLLVVLATLIVAAATRRAGPARLGGMVGFVAIQVVPFLVRAAGTPPTPGLRATVNLSGWFLQPLGMLLLGVISVIAGAWLGLGLERDVRRLVALLRPRRRLWPTVPVVAVLVVLAAAAALTALQDGPLGALRSYSVVVPPAADPPTVAPLPTALPPVAPGVALVPALTPTATPGPVHHTPSGVIRTITVAGRIAYVYLPAAYQASNTLRVPVVYFLHGFPAQPSQWLGSGGQLNGVLDQLIATRALPPLIAVMPNGNGANNSNTQWGNTSLGQIETWLVTQLVPAVDGRYRTLGATYRGVAGLSTGGFGAVNLAIRNPGVFRWAASYSGFFVAPANTFGSNGPSNSPQDTAPQLPTSERMPIYLGYGTDDVTYNTDTEKFAALLNSISWSPVKVSAVYGGHGWETWRAEVVQSLTWLGHLWGPNPSPTPTPAATSPTPTPTAGPPSPTPTPTPTPTLATSTPTPTTGSAR